MEARSSVHWSARQWKDSHVKALINQLGQPCLYVKGFKSEYAPSRKHGRGVLKGTHDYSLLLVLEDLDSMIDDDNRSFFLNELDGFENNSGLVVLATTNHADLLTQRFSIVPAALTASTISTYRVSRNDGAYVVAWNSS